MFNDFFSILYNSIYLPLLDSLYMFDFFKLTFYDAFDLGQMFATFLIIGILILLLYIPFKIFSSIFNMLGV